MKNDREKIKEPFTPERTPTPPQVEDPNLRNERNEKGTPEEIHATSNKKQHAEGKKKLGDDTEINDETTI